MYGYGRGYGGGGYGYGYGGASGGSGGGQKSPKPFKQRPASSPTFPASSDSGGNGYSVARLKGMLEQHVAQERNMWHSIAHNTNTNNSSPNNTHYTQSQ